ncbi:MAG: type II toxin-antitoxin system VapC family toxin [Coriobacteriia bacterium]|nr:type II toxin-antitoxin system VapC family toxin [Coriobacteriia bacterium]
MSYLIDTNVISELRKDPQKMDAAFRQWAQEVDLNQCFLSVVSVLELERGIQVKELSDPAQGQLLRTWLTDYVLEAFRDRLVVISLPAARIAAGYHVPDPAPYYDALIAASAAADNYTVVTRNEKDFNRFDIPSINPWEPPV